MRAIAKGDEPACLASLHDSANDRVFDSVIVITDRVVLDKQLQDTIYQFEHKHGVVQKIDDNSRQLAEALESSVPIIITTLQKFPFVSRQLIRLAEERGDDGGGVLKTRNFAVIIDEAHSSQGGEAATDLKEVLGGQRLREEAQRYMAENDSVGEDELFRSMAKRGRQANISFFAFTATPKHKTLAVFGNGGKPAHRYTIREDMLDPPPGIEGDRVSSWSVLAPFKADAFDRLRVETRSAAV